MEKEGFDLIIVGGGTAGLRSALYSAGHGHKTLLISSGQLGGTCLNTGCIPTKAMLHAAHLFSLSNDLKKFGIEVGKVKLDFKKLMDRVRDIIKSGQEHISASIKNQNLVLVKEKASFAGENSIQAGGKIFYGDKFIICTGAKSYIPAIKGLDEAGYMISDDVIKLNVMPKSLAVIGGGYISIELSMFFHSLGCKVSIIEKAENLLSSTDKDVRELINEIYVKDGIDIYTNSEIKEIKKLGNKKRIIFNDGKSAKNIEVDDILIAAGRISNTMGLQLEMAKVLKGERGNIEVNSFLETSNKRIYAIGDVTGKAMFAHAAKRESHIALSNALDNTRLEMNFDLVPWAVFSDPPISGIGLSEDIALKKGIKYGILKASFIRAGRATIIDDTRGFAKILYDKRNNKIIGCVIIGPCADELVHEFSALMNSGATIDILRETIHIHPTLSEVFEALKES